MKDILLTTEEVAERYKISKYKQTLYREKQEMPFVRIGKEILYEKILLDMWLKRFSVNEVATENTKETS